MMLQFVTGWPNAIYSVHKSKTNYPIMSTKATKIRLWPSKEGTMEADGTNGTSKARRHKIRVSCYYVLGTQDRELVPATTS